MLPERIPDIPLAWVILLQPYKGSLIRPCLCVPRTSRAIHLRKSWSPERGSGHGMAPKGQAPVQPTAAPLGILHILCPCMFSQKCAVLIYWMGVMIHFYLCTCACVNTHTPMWSEPIECPSESQIPLLCAEFHFSQDCRELHQAGKCSGLCSVPGT